MRLYLDDCRPCPIGWRLATTVDEAIALLKTGDVERASLDHDLGACESCLEEWRAGEIVMEVPNCEHYGTGYTLVCWMERENVWPTHKPVVHSMNPVGKQRMQQAIDRAWALRTEVAK